MNEILEIDTLDLPIYDPKNVFIKYSVNSNQGIKQAAENALEALYEIDKINEENWYEIKRGAGVSLEAAECETKISYLQKKVERYSAMIGHIENVLS